MGGFRVRVVAFVLGFAGAAFLMVALFLWAVSQLQIHSTGLEPLDWALVIVPGVTGASAGGAALLLLALSQRHHPVSTRPADVAVSSEPGNSSAVSSRAVPESAIS